jgi:hypothetical protein
MSRLHAIGLLVLPSAALGAAASSDPPAAGVAIAICTPEHVYAAKDRAHVRCIESAGGILFFAAPMSDQARSTQVVHKGLQAIGAGGRLRIEYDPADKSGTAWGCLAHDCRPAISIQPHQKPGGKP